MSKRATVVGAGFAGVEAAAQLSRAGIAVDLYEMKPVRYSPAHKSPDFAELICSNSFKAKRVGSAAGLMKEEMSQFHSLCVSCAQETAVPAGGSLSVDRAAFSRMVTEAIEGDPNITVHREEVTKIPDEGDAVIIAAGPLASDALAADIEQLCGDSLHFFDAVAPIVSGDSVDMSRAFCQSRYDRGGDDDYINCPMNKEEYERFYDALIHAESAELHDFDKKHGVYEGCMPIEVMASRGPDTMRFGPLKPVGLRDPHTGHRPWAALQLRKETREGSMYNLVGFQTNLKWGEQKRVFSMIPGLEHAEFLRYGVMHRNTFLNSPQLLDADFHFRERPGLYFAGQITGVEGYMESAMSGILAGLNAARYINGEEPLILPRFTMMGALSSYISDKMIENFQPMGANFGVIPPLPERIRDKKQRYEALAQRSLDWFHENLGGAL
ncbi:MAG: methylenetetrahydrofolate--tRNA-(uracil(54)-C(5))-methyltransferase (FADH(2)-oxidizing) TrmFO [Acutalibacteraceae bacterium]|nr:methylenetetrahydrofolate--tRNA-(uracil(54)-C(5))-methyltransferase (FADH(2)-oxidizing) TrmFO [Acutalibacteraceae bacterium]